MASSERIWDLWAPGRRVLDWPEVTKIGNVIDLAGKFYGKLTVISLSGRNKRRGSTWLCRCECGNEKVIPADSLSKGRSNSCGCASNALRSAAMTRHGHAVRHQASGTYSSWAAAINRCNRPSFHQYADYGGRGIRVCARWMDFATFLQDMGERPEGCSLDRVDPNGNYEPGNCRWATKSEQAKNKRLRIKRADYERLLNVAHAVAAATETEFDTALAALQREVRHRGGGSA